MSSNLWLVIGMVGFGAFNTIVRKAQLETCSHSSFAVDPILAKSCIDPFSEPFNKPWIGNLFMFLGEVLLVIVLKQETKQRTILQQMNSQTVDARKNIPSNFFAIPALLDVLGSGFSGIGMLYLSASVWQMMRGSLLIYTAILSVVFLGRKLNFQHIVGLVLAAIGLTLVGISSYLDEKQAVSEHSLVAVGIGLTVLAQLCTAIQVVLEEYFMKEWSMYLAPSPARVVTFEGVWGSLLMVALLFVFQHLPGSDHGSVENSIDSFEKISNSETLVVLILGYLLSIAIFNVLGMIVSKRLSSLHRTLIDSMRSVVVWLIQLSLGDSWNNHSWLQALGFAVLVWGTLVYNEVLTISNSSEISQEQDPMLAE